VPVQTSFEQLFRITKVSGIELLKDVLVIEVLEDGDGLVQLVIDLTLGNALLRFLQQVVAIAGQLKSRD
jgi:hypothetical protein